MSDVMDYFDEVDFNSLLWMIVFKFMNFAFPSSAYELQLATIFTS